MKVLVHIQAAWTLASKFRLRRYWPLIPEQGRTSENSAYLCLGTQWVPLVFGHNSDRAQLTVLLEMSKDPTGNDHLTTYRIHAKYSFPSHLKRFSACPQAKQDVSW